MATWAMGGDPNNTNGWQSYTNGFVYTNGYGFPTGNRNDVGNYPIYIGGIRADYLTGNGAHARVHYQGVETAGGYTWQSSGGSGQLRFVASSGTMYFGRNTGNGFTTVSGNDGYTWTGGLCGEFDWATVSTPPRNQSAAVTGPRQITVTFIGPSWNGDSAISQYILQSSINGGSWGGNSSNVNGTLVYNNLTPGYTYRFRITAVNGVGWSDWVYTSTLTAIGGGKRYSGTAWGSLATAKRYSGSAWTDLTTRKRYTGSAWTDITN